MNFEILTQLPLALDIHLWSAVTALGLGPFVLYRRRRDRIHKVLGYVWVAAMVSAAGSALWLPAVVLPIAAGFGIIHLFVPIVFHGLWRGIAAIRAGDITEHEAQMRGLYQTALLITGALTFLPGRVLNRVTFPDAPELGFLVIAGVGGLIFVNWLRGRRHLRTVR